MRVRILYVDPERRTQFHEQLRGRDVVTGFEARVRRKDGRVIWIAENARAVRDEDGTLLYYEGMVEDITARKQAEESRILSERRLREAQKAAKLGSWDYDPLTGKITWSDEVCEMFGVEAGGREPDYETFLRFIHPADREAVHAAVEEAISQGKPYEFDIRIRGRDRTVRYVHATGRPIFVEGGAVAGLFGTMLDITERKRYERQLQEQRRQLMAANKKLETLATLDGLTGLKNHRAFQETLELEFQRFKRHGFPLSLLLLDVQQLQAVQ